MMAYYLVKADCANLQKAPVRNNLLAQFSEHIKQDTGECMLLLSLTTGCDMKTNLTLTGSCFF